MMPDSNVADLINTLPPFHQQQVIDFIVFLQATEQTKTSPVTSEAATDNNPSRLRREKGVLVIDTGEVNEFDINAFIGELREERIQDQIRQVYP